MSAGFELPMVVAPRDAGWHRAARIAVVLSWASLFYMAVEGGVGVWQGVVAGSVALVGWGLASFIEGVASAIVIWRFTGSRTLSDTAEQRAQKLVAVQFFILAPYVLIESAKTLVEGGHADITVIGMVASARRPPRARERRTSSAASRLPPCWSDWPPTPPPAPGGSTRSSASSSRSSRSRRAVNRGAGTAAARIAAADAYRRARPSTCGATGTVTKHGSNITRR
jgi:hypothetical protein